jgi:transposase
MFIRSKKVKGFVYLQLVESKREGKKTKQIVLKSLGRLDTLQENGQLDGLVRSGARFSQRLAVLDAHEKGESTPIRSTTIGPVIVFEKLWKQTGIDTILEEKQQGRKYEFSIERAIFLTVLHRLCVSGSDRAAEEWKRNHAISGAEKIDLHHLYRAMAWLGEELDPEQQAGRTPFSPRCVKDEIEEALFNARRDLFSGLALVFFDTTSLYFEGDGGDDLGYHGHSKDHRPDLKQMVVGIILDDTGNPICSELWPGNTADVKTLVPVAERLNWIFRQEIFIAH